MTLNYEDEKKKFLAEALSLAHAGTLGMRWGYRKRRGSTPASTPASNNSKAAESTKPKAGGGSSGGSSSKAVAKPASTAPAKQAPVKKLPPKPFKKLEPQTDRGRTVDSLGKTSVTTLTNAQLKAANERMNLERSYKALTAETSSMTAGKKRIAQVLALGKTVNDVYTLYNSPAVQAGLKQLRKSK